MGSGVAVKLLQDLWTASGRRYIMGETLSVVGEWNGKLDLDGPNGRLYRVPVIAVELVPPPEPAKPLPKPKRRIPIGSLEVL